MTPDPWDELTPQERDAAVAERVLGWISVASCHRYSGPASHFHRGRNLSLCDSPNRLSTTWEGAGLLLEVAREWSAEAKQRFEDYLDLQTRGYWQRLTPELVARAALESHPEPREEQKQ